MSERKKSAGRKGSKTRDEGAKGSSAAQAVDDAKNRAKIGVYQVQNVSESFFVSAQLNAITTR